MQTPSVHFRPWPHRLAVVTTCAVFPLIFVGAGVTSKDAGMAYPDGFLSNGHFLNPPGWLESDATLWEHGHRLLGRVVGLFAIALACASWSSRGTVRAMGLISLLAIVAQGLLGWFRVDLISTKLAMVHGIGAQICICMVATTALVTSRRWIERQEFVSVRAGDFLRKLTLAAFIFVFLQMATGALTRHFPGDLAVGTHVFLAIAVTFILGWVSMWVTGSFAASTLMGALGRLIAIAMVVQLMLGGTTFLVVTLGALHDPLSQWLVPTLHTAVGAVLLVGCLLQHLTCRRMVGSSMSGETDFRGALVAS